jgi:alkanesulfonate monooxygenase SsuD/methylene tetrahydromethanopterin reductase-like flavin-dependent oxidoreductase (luciferase family)
MAMCALRFDLRNPSFAGTSASERMRAALDMAAWADTRGCVSISLSEHHGSGDGFLPSPIVFAAALAARTTTARIGISALIAPFYDPLRLAEDLAVLDNISGGRIDIVVAAGYVADEFSMFGVPPGERAARLRETVDTLRNAWGAKPFQFRGRTVLVTPEPHQPGGPAIVMGGSSEAAARRAARLADGFIPSNQAAWRTYRDEMTALGKPDPGPGRSGSMAATYLTEDVEAGWEELTPYFLHDTNAYAEWLDRNSMEGPYKTTTAEGVRKSGNYRVVTPDALVEELRPLGSAAFVFLHPLAGGIPPETAWKSLRLFEKAQAALASRGSHG